MLTELHDYQLTPAGLFEVWPTEGSEPYQFAALALISWASLRNMKHYGAWPVDDFGNNMVVTNLVSQTWPTEEITPWSQSFGAWWDSVGAKDALLLDYLNAEITGIRASMPAALTTAEEKEQGSVDGLPIV